MFITNRGEIENRLDAYYYKPSFKLLDAEIGKKAFVLLKDVSEELKNGSTPPGGFFEECGIPYFRSQDFELFDFEINQFITPEYHLKLRRSAIKPDDVLVAVVGATLGQVGIVPNYIKEGNINQNISRIRIKDNQLQNIQPKYLGIFLATSAGKKLIYRNATITTQSYMNNEQLGSIKVPLPNQKVQTKIIDIALAADKQKNEKQAAAFAIVHSIDNYIANEIGFHFPEIRPVQSFKVKISNFESRLDPHFYLPGFKALIDNIRQINHAQLGDVAEFSNETWNQKDGFENEFPYIEISEIDLASGKIRNISYIPISEAPSRARMVLRTNDIIVSSTRPHRGAIAFIKEPQNGFIASTGFVVLRKLLRADISKEYLFYILRTQICLQQMLQRSSGGSYPAITSEELKKIFIPIPSPEVQHQIVVDIKAFIDKAETLQAEAKQDLEKAKQKIESLILS